MLFLIACDGKWKCTFTTNIHQMIEIPHKTSNFTNNRTSYENHTRTILTKSIWMCTIHAWYMAYGICSDSANSSCVKIIILFSDANELYACVCVCVCASHRSYIDIGPQSEINRKLWCFYSSDPITCVFSIHIYILNRLRMRIVSICSNYLSQPVLNWLSFISCGECNHIYVCQPYYKILSPTLFSHPPIFNCCLKPNRLTNFHHTLTPLNVNHENRHAYYLHRT